jgi:hypothetical protein
MPPEPSVVITSQPGGAFRGLRNLLALLILVIGFLPAPARTAAMEEEGIRFEAERPEWIRATVPPLLTMRQRLFFYFGPVNDSGTVVYITSGREEFLEAIGSAFPDWGVAAAQPRQRQIFLQAPAIVSDRQPYGQVVGHEYAHVYLHLRAGPRARIPRWLDEGFALHAAFEWDMGRYFRLARAALGGGLLRLAELEGVNRFSGEKAALAYTQSFAAYQYLEREYGRESVLELILALGRGQRLDAAFREAFGTGYASFQMALEQDIRGRYNVLSLFTDAGFIWALLALLIIVGWLLKKRRARAIERRWQLEDRIGGEPDFNQWVDPDDDESWRGGA